MSVLFYITGQIVWVIVGIFILDWIFHGFILNFARAISIIRWYMTINNQLGHKYPIWEYMKVFFKTWRELMFDFVPDSISNNKGVWHDIGDWVVYKD